MRKVRKLSASDIPDSDGITGGPPCQAWSEGGNRRGIEDEREHTTALHGFLDMLKSAGYNICYELLNAADYKVPQDRFRVFFIGIRNDLNVKFSFPDAACTTPVTLRQAIGDIVEVPRYYGEDSAMSDHPNRTNHDVYAGPYDQKYMSRNRVRSWDEPSFTMQAQARNAPQHPQAPKMSYLSAKERCKIQKEYLYRAAYVLDNRTFNDYESIGAIFQYSSADLHTLLNNDEFQVLSQFTIVLGEKGGEEIKDISSISNYSTHPVIKLPNGNYYIPNLYILAKAINESPYYWLKNSPNQKRLRILLGKSNEHIAYSLLRRCIGDNVYKGILIKKEHAKKEVTDIDAMFSIDNDVFVVQVKSKKLTQPSADGNEESIMTDFDQAVLSAYNQGLKSVDALRLHDEYPNLSKYTSSINNPLYHIICITGDYFPTLSSTVYEHQQHNQKSEFPIVAMTMFDLETITYFFEASRLKDYLVYRENCSRLMIYGDNEMFYLGKYIALNTEPDEPVLSFGEILYWDYAVLVDYIIQCAKADGISSNAFSYFWKFIEDDTSPLLTELAIVYHSLREKPRKFRNGMRMFDPKDHNKYMYFK